MELPYKRPDKNDRELRFLSSPDLSGRIEGTFPEYFFRQPGKFIVSAFDQCNFLSSCPALNLLFAVISVIDTGKLLKVDQFYRQSLSGVIGAITGLMLAKSSL